MLCIDKQAYARGMYHSSSRNWDDELDYQTHTAAVCILLASSTATSCHSDETDEIDEGEENAGGVVSVPIPVEEEELSAVATAANLTQQILYHYGADLLDPSIRRDFMELRKNTLVKKFKRVKALLKDLYERTVYNGLCKCSSICIDQIVRIIRS